MERAGWRVVLLVALAVAVASCGGSSTPVRVAAASDRALDGPTFNHPVTAPPFALHNYRGRVVRLMSYRGKAVLLTFIYTHCHDVCPTIVAALHSALGLLGSRAAEVQVVGVSVDPRGDTPAAIAGFLAAHEMTGRMQYLVASRAVLKPVWRAWGIDATNPSASDTVNHTAAVFGIGANGKVMTAYPANFTPGEVAHDVPILAGL
jgi:protein SCO1/2